ncbi:hypothetical protein B9Z19DRAFT_761198 [Tuber borchii]|uniref:Uncharacterized protein n=1 Tax=Tuber borchii TaxID=42251 RepID=A0A2T6ZXC5_TUBBO|nr:hypothetical protein B9Z19DRAFT_761198 [Tuber borchii]
MESVSKKRGSSDAVLIPVPGAKGRSSASLLRGGFGPVNTLNKPQHSRSPVRTKRKLTQSEALADQPFRPKRQKEEDSIVLKNLSGSSASTVKDSDAKKSKYFPQTARDTTFEPPQSSSRAGSEETVDSFTALVNSVPEIPSTRKMLDPSSWVSKSNDPQHTRWKTTPPKRTQVPPKKPVFFPLTRFQRGSTVVENTCSHENCRGLVIEKSNTKDSKEYKVMHGPEEVKDLTFQVDKIRKIYVTQRSVRSI